MKLNVAAELRALGRLTAGELRQKYLQVFGEESRSGNKDFLRKRIARRIQALFAFVFSAVHGASGRRGNPACTPRPCRSGEVGVYS